MNVDVTCKEATKQQLAPELTVFAQTSLFEELPGEWCPSGDASKFIDARGEEQYVEEQLDLFSFYDEFFLCNWLVCFSSQ